MKGLKTITFILAVGFSLSFWWLGPLVGSAFLAGMYFMWLNYDKVKIIKEAW